MLRKTGSQQPLVLLVVLFSPLWLLSGCAIGGESDGEETANVNVELLPDEQDASILTAEFGASGNPTPSASSESRYYLGSVVNSGLDNGFSGADKIGVDDPHYGWKLGSFFVDGYTRVSEDGKSDPVFIKTLGDKVTLRFSLEQDIGKLNGNEGLSIGEDSNGYDEAFGLEKQNFGHGTLITRRTDERHFTEDPVVYIDFLAGTLVGANTTVELFEEGDYEVALDYEVASKQLLGIETHSNYRLTGRFSVRNGNCMVYPFDVKTKAELTNSSLTENGFYLDLAKSRYLDIDIKREVLAEGADGLTMDTRFNKPAKDGNEYTEEGVYTITISNRYTKQQDVKQIYVGTNDLLKAHVATGLSIRQINEQLTLGAQIESDGTIIPPAGQASPSPSVDKAEPTSSGEIPIVPLIVGGVVVLVAVVVAVVVILRRRSLSKLRRNTPQTEEAPSDIEEGGK